MFFFFKGRAIVRSGIQTTHIQYSYNKKGTSLKASTMKKVQYTHTEKKKKRLMRLACAQSQQKLLEVKIAPTLRLCKPVLLYFRRIKSSVTTRHKPVSGFFRRKSQIFNKVISTKHLYCCLYKDFFLILTLIT